MIGMIHKVLFDMAEDQGGLEAVAAIRKRAGVPVGKPYFMNMDYSDAECMALIAATAEHFGLSAEQAYDLYAKYFLAYALKSFPRFFEQARSAREFLELQPKIHSKFAAGKKNQDDLERVNRKFRPVDDGSDDLVIRYHSDNGLCQLYEALARRLFRHYGEAGRISQDQCAHEGASCCQFRVRFAEGAGRLHPPLRAAS